MKKTTCILLVIMLVLSLAACGNTGVQAVEKTAAETAEAFADSGENITAAEEPQKDTSEEPTEEASEEAEEVAEKEPEEVPEEEPKCIRGWSEDSPAMAEIMAFVESITDESSPDYVPPEKRIAIFDSDGTLIGERYPTLSDRSMLLYRLLHDSTYKGSTKYKSFAKATEKAIANHEELPVTPRDTVEMCSETFAGCTVDKYREYVKEFMNQPVPGFEGMTYGTRYFVPMVELARYLVDNGFMVYVCSGTERNFLRAMYEVIMGDCVPPYRVIGSTVSLYATGQDGKSGQSYVYGPKDRVLINGKMTVKNMNMNKVTRVVNEIGVAPVLVFGNSSGDFSMAQYALQNGGKAWMLLCDDTERDYGDVNEAASFAKSCEKYGFGTVSMRDEFETIYDDGIAMDAPMALDTAA